jgi:hypothetical protein
MIAVDMRGFDVGRKGKKKADPEGPAVKVLGEDA